MKIETYIDSLVAYAMNCGLTDPECLPTGSWICCRWMTTPPPTRC